MDKKYRVTKQFADGRTVTETTRVEFPIGFRATAKSSYCWNYTVIECKEVSK